MPGAFGCLSVIGKTSHLPCCPRSHTVGRARAARPETPIELQPLRGMLIAGGKVSFACPNIPFDSTARAVICRSIAAIAGLANAAGSFFGWRSCAESSVQPIDPSFDHGNFGVD